MDSFGPGEFVVIFYAKELPLNVQMQQWSARD